VKLRVFLTAAVAGAALLVAPAPVQAAAVNAPCHPAAPIEAPATTEYFDSGRPYLGPQDLPRFGAVGWLLTGYQRLGKMSEKSFLASYRTQTGWVYPPADGFKVVHGRPVKHEQRIRPGERIDRFGYPGGAYLSPARTPFAERALPPQNLTTPSGTPESNYHLYCVLKSFDVDAGPIAPWFAQPGDGTQYKLNTAYLRGAGDTPSVTWLLDNGFLTEERPKELR
jgi:hypothetical protein